MSPSAPEPDRAPTSEPVDKPVDEPADYHVDVALRWSDMDAYGHVNNVQYLRLLEEARVQAFEDWFGGHHVGDRGMVIGRSEIEYLLPLEHRIAPIAIEVWVTQVAAASFDLGYRVVDGTGGPDQRVYALAETTLVAYDLTRGVPIRLEPRHREALDRHRGGPVPFRRRR
ncbi:acyl-CoA thioesterase [Arsenicicoccus piscis]|uniref:Acyl-CoA thioesterase n=1 Tax=Arsenicicoccus piscis TaxID=673954 RepID=A0ABQ6HJJ5_9MICO|nr:acyl-CoA thioesterase [Arsenicicoccus piscis]GMA18666.1 hypothetical protein GCM10025862_06870 [Arsenicicoccus piscis]